MGTWFVLHEIYYGEPLYQIKLRSFLKRASMACNAVNKKMLDNYLNSRKEPQDKNSIDYVVGCLTHKDPNQRMDLKVAREKMKNLSK